ncbi:MAG TPA: hypothetical protein VFI20_04015 [Terracidiphilus sp.]|nr:hypothetical protein [Terracidiphilus sp.]
MLRFAAWSSGLSKLTGAALQAVAIPLIYHTLGVHEYAIYLLLTAALATMSLMQLGAGPALSQAIAKANAEGKTQDEGCALGAAILFTSVISLLGGSAIAMAVRIFPAAMVFGPAFASDQLEIIHYTDAVVLIVILVVLASVVDSALAGYQEQYKTNLGVCISNVLSVVALLVVCWYHANLIEIIFALYATPVLSRIVNFSILLRQRAYLISGMFRFKSKTLRLMSSSGVAFWIIQLASLIEQHGGTYILAHMTNPQITDIFGIIYRAIGLITSIVGILTQPLWPAFTDAVTRHDHKWIYRTARQIRKALIYLALFLSAATIFVGPWAIHNVWKISIVGYHSVVVLLGIYIAFNIWTHYYYVILMGLERVWEVAFVIIAENVLMVAFGMALVVRYGANGMAVAYLFASLFLPAWLLPRLFKKTIAELMPASLRL